MELYKLLDKVIDEATFVEFMEALAKDFDDEQEKEKVKPSSPYGPGVNGWENPDLSSFLWAATSWAQASKSGLPMYQKPENPWKRMADILYAAKIYE